MDRIPFFPDDEMVVEHGLRSHSWKWVEPGFKLTSASLQVLLLSFMLHS